MHNWLNLIRWKNLILIGLSQILIVWSIYTIDLLTLPVIFFILCTLCFAAGGNIINDVFDTIPDAINKPNKVIIDKTISKQKALVLYGVLNFLGFLFIVWGSIILQNKLPFYFGIPAVVLLYFYSKYFKGMPVLGNIVIASFTSFSLLFFLILIPSNHLQTISIYALALFCFLINWTREIIKDIEDAKGDRAAHLKTLPVLIGTKRTLRLVRSIIFITLFCLIALLYITTNTPLKAYLTITIIVPLTYVLGILKYSNQKNVFSKISTILKIIIGFGIFTVLFI